MSAMYNIRNSLENIRDHVDNLDCTATESECTDIRCELDNISEELDNLYDDIADSASSDEFSALIPEGMSAGEADSLKEAITNWRAEHGYSNC